MPSPSNTLSQDSRDPDAKEADVANQTETGKLCSLLKARTVQHGTVRCGSAMSIEEYVHTIETKILHKVCSPAEFSLEPVAHMISECGHGVAEQRYRTCSSHLLTSSRKIRACCTVPAVQLGRVGSFDDAHRISCVPSGLARSVLQTQTSGIITRYPSHWHPTRFV